MATLSFAPSAWAHPSHPAGRSLKRGMSGADVRSLQRLLTLAGYSTPQTGLFGALTDGNIIRFERHFHLPALHAVTPAMMRALQVVAFVKSAETKRPAVATIGSPVAGAPQAETADLAGSGGAGINEPALGTSGPVGRASLNADGTASPPAGAPAVIDEIFAAANRIASKPYIYGGGHGSFKDSGYDCSGSVSYALHGGGLLSAPEDSGTLESYGRPGPGRWITIYANSGHTFMIIAGIRFDTAAQSSTGGSRWTDRSRSTSGYVVVHPKGW